MRVKSTIRLTRLNHDFIRECKQRGEGSENYLINLALMTIREAGFKSITEFSLQTKKCATTFIDLPE